MTGQDKKIQEFIGEKRVSRLVEMALDDIEAVVWDGAKVRMEQWLSKNDEDWSPYDGERPELFGCEVCLAGAVMLRRGMYKPWGSEPNDDNVRGPECRTQGASERLHAIDHVRSGRTGCAYEQLGHLIGRLGICPDLANRVDEDIDGASPEELANEWYHSPEGKERVEEIDEYDPDYDYRAGDFGPAWDKALDELRGLEAGGADDWNGKVNWFHPVVDTMFSLSGGLEECRVQETVEWYRRIVVPQLRKIEADAGIG